MSDIVKKDDLTSLDNFAGWEDGVEGSDRQQGGGIIQGVKIKLSNTAAWLQRDDEEMPPNLELIAINVIRVVQMWGPDGIGRHTAKKTTSYLTKTCPGSACATARASEPGFI